MPAHDLARALRDSGRCAWLVTFNVWNSAARLAPLVVGERGALAALGFQDVFDDSLAEFVHGLLLEKLRGSGWNLPAAFESMWREVRLLPESVDATGITLWAGQPLLDATPKPAAAAPPARAVEQGEVTAAPRRAGAPGRGEPPPVRVEVKPFAELNYAVLHARGPRCSRSSCSRPNAPDAHPVLDIEVAVHMGAEAAAAPAAV